MRLYEIQQQYIELILLLEEQGGEILEGQEEMLTIVEEDFKNKADQYSKIIKSLEADINFANSEIQRISRFISTKANIQVRLEKNLVEALKLFGTKDKEKQIWRYQTGTFKLGTRRTEAVEIDETIIDDKWKRVSITNLTIEEETKVLDLIGKSQEEVNARVDILKTPIKASIQAGEVIEGAKIVENYNLNLR